jgi:multidrug/hemolysin transport system ATP-binding protein
MHIRAGERFVLAGPSGAGKTTLLAMIATLLPPSAGIVNVDGFQLNRENFAIRGRIGVVFEDGLLDNRLTIRENLRVRASFYGLRGSEIEDAVARSSEVTDLSLLLDIRYGRLSEANRRRADIARALLNDPALVLLDDPARGLDAEASDAVLALVARLTEATGTAVLQTTRSFDRLAGADRIGVMDRGRILAEGTPTALVDRYAEDRLRLVPRPDAGSRETLLRLLDVEGYRYVAGTSADGPMIEVAIVNSMGALVVLNRIVHLILRFEMMRGDLGDACRRILREANPARQALHGSEAAS